ncbi:pentapeptide repeat-containing protein [Amycolatopsis sp. NBRC 101858]|uniref:pentapeptide repeat-containing protein n=1 Tax=Amycolatopsis sp. NBRC 101858 TaxID=3032200 RepID=UPI00255243B7|nr:pentapeptide repeat-containing protein [Amycolatopsis sp. NBRC 101858]
MIAAGLPMMIVVAVAAVWLLLGMRVDGDRLDAIRTGGTLGVGLGGVVALWLAVRRQRSTELDVLQKYEVHRLAERTAQDARDDVIDRRITEQYTKAVEQLGQSAPVRLGGLYALERLAQNNLGQRQTIVNVLCAYLRMPFTPPVRPAETFDAAVRREPSVRPGKAGEDIDPRHQELQVRLAAQRILADHLITEDSEKRWADIDLDLTGATLVDFDFHDRRVREAKFADATFIGDADFSNTAFDGKATFSRAQFTGRAEFSNAVFAAAAWFFKTWFLGSGNFRLTSFRYLRFEGVRTDGPLAFEEAKLGMAWFGSACFSRP